MIPQTIRRFLQPAVAIMRWFRRKHLHAVVVGPGASAFGLIGTSRWRDRFARVYFDNGSARRTAFRMHGLSWETTAQALAKRYGLVVVSDVSVPTTIAAELLRVPNFVGMHLDLQESEEMYRSMLPKSARADVAKVRARKLTSDLSHDVEWCGEFHDRYHRPSILSRHGEEGFVMSAPEMARMVQERGGEFICVSQGGQRIGAILNEVNDGRYTLGRIGWLDGDPQWAREGVSSALYWSSMQRARNLGFRHVQLGGTPPFVDGGVFQYKAKWGAVVDRAETVWGDHGLLLNPSHPSARWMLRNHAMLVLNARDELVVISGKHPDDVKLPSTAIRSVARWYQLRDFPSIDAEGENTELPRNLRAWFDAKSHWEGR